MTMKTDRACAHPNGECAALPELVRMNYFHGQLISDRDLRTEQEYFRAKLRHAHRCIHGYGVLCGLEVRPVPGREECRPEADDRRDRIRVRLAEIEREIEALEKATGDDDAAAKSSGEKRRALEEERESLLRELEAIEDDGAPPDDEARPPAEHLVELSCGAAVDCDGNDIIVGGAVPVDLDSLLGCASHEAEADDRDDGPRQGARTAYLSICYQECGREPTRPFELDECATSLRCHDARMVEGWRLTASYERPPEDERCDLCCSPCEEACLLLAAIRVDPEREIRAGDIDHSVRRRFGLYEPTVITGINWRHDFDYAYDTAALLLGTRDRNAGLEIAFSRPVRRGTLTRGVVDLWRITGGRGGAGEHLNLEAEYVGLPGDPDAMVDRIRIRNGSEERVQSHDRIFIVVRTAFILDACCRPVEGAHIGGRVPRLPDDSEAGRAALKEEEGHEPPGGCEHPPHGPMPWTSGAGGNFESWFYVSEA